MAEAAHDIFGKTERSSDLAILIGLFTRLYWDGVWVIQEIAVVAKVKIIFGGTQISWSSISAYPESSEQDDQFVPILNGALTLSHFRNKLSISHQSLNLHQSLERGTPSLWLRIRETRYSPFLVSRMTDLQLSLCRTTNNHLTEP